MDEDKHTAGDMETLFKVRIPEGRARVMRELIALFLLLFGMLMGFAMFAGVQYWTCTLKSEDITFMQCIRGEALKAKKASSDR